MTGARLASGAELRSSEIAKIRNSRMAVPMIWSRSAPHWVTGSVPLPGRVEKTPCVLIVCPGSTLARTSA